MASQDPTQLRVDSDSQTQRGILRVLNDWWTNGIDFGSLGKFTTLDLTGAAPGAPVLGRYYKDGLRAFARVKGSDATILAGMNIIAARSSAGIYAITFGTNMPNGNYTILLSLDTTGGSSARFILCNTISSTGFNVAVSNATDTLNVDPTSFSVAIFAN